MSGRTGWTVRWGARSLAVLGVAAALTWPAALEAQRRGRMEPGDRLQGQAREVLEARIRARFAEIVKTQLGLSEDEMTRLRETVREFEDARRDLAREEGELRAGLQPLLQPRGSAEELGEDEARELLGRLAEIRLREAELFRREQEAFLEILRPAQLVRLYRLREALGNRIRHLRGGGPPGARRGGPPVGPPRPPGLP